MRKALSVLLALALVLALGVPAASAAGTGITLQKKYTVVDYKEESWGTPPVAVDLDGDGKIEVLHGAYTLTVADGATGQIKWQVNGGKDRSSPYGDYQNVTAGMMFCKFIVKDFNGDGKNEIALGYGNGSISLLNNQGYFMSGFPVSIPGARVQALAADDVDGDGKVEIIAGVSGKGPASLYVYGCDGKLKPGWPQLTYNAAENLDAWSYSYDIYNDGIATGDLDGDGLPEIVAPLDNYAVAAYNGDGTHVMVDNSVFKSEGDHFDFGGDIPWIAVSLFEDYGEELRRANGGLGGWGLTYESLAEKGRKGTYGPGMTYAAARFADVDGDGTQEVLIAAGVADRTVRIQNPDDINCFNITHTMYPTVFIYNGDHTRMNQNGCSWENIPTNLTASTLGKPLNQNPKDGSGYTRLLDGGVHSVPVVGDINGDGVNEILFNAFDGKVHCFSAKDSQHELAGWPYTLPGNSSGAYYEYAAEPTLADVNGDGKLDVVVVSWTETESSKHPANPRTGYNGSIYILDGSGKLLAQQKLDPMVVYDNVSRSKPAVADIDGDKQMEILISSSDYGGLIAYDVVGGAAQQPQQPQNVASPNPQKITINGGEAIELKAYVLYDKNGNGSNYIPVRDLAWYVTQALGEGAGVFDARWDASAGAINLVTGQPFGSPDGKEGTDRFTGPQAYYRESVPILVNGQKADLEFITLKDAAGNGTTYYKLADLCRQLGLGVSYDAATRTAAITTK